MADPVTLSFAAYATGLWALKKTGGAFQKLLIDEPLKHKAKEFTDKVTSKVKEAVGNYTPTPATNHDLQRALAMAVCKAAEMRLVVPLGEIIQIPEFKDHVRVELEAFLKRLKDYLRDIRLSAGSEQSNLKVVSTMS